MKMKLHCSPDYRVGLDSDFVLVNSVFENLKKMLWN